MRPICVPCHRFYSAEKTGHYFLEGRSNEVPGTSDGHTARSAAPGLSEAEHWSPYKLWSGDLWRCPGCGHQIVSGTGRAPVAEHYEKDFADHVADACGDTPFQVNDC